MYSIYSNWNLHLLNKKVKKDEREYNDIKENKFFFHYKTEKWEINNSS